MVAPGVPLIIGAGFTGLAISSELSRAGIEHVLVGSGLPDPPRLGETLEVIGSCEILRIFPEYADHLYPKVNTRVFFGDRVVTFNFNANRGANLLYRGLGIGAIPSFFHMDRTGFDDAMFADVTQKPQVRYIDDLVAEVNYDAQTDRIDSVTLRSGETIATSHVFDASSFARVVARAAALTSKTLGACLLYTSPSPRDA